MTVMVLAPLGVVIAALVGLAGVWLSDRTQMKKLVSDANSVLVDNLQEERKEIKADLNQLKRHVGGLMLQGRYKDDYINELRAHIEAGNPPPPPTYPPGLLRIASEGLTSAPYL